MASLIGRGPQPTMHPLHSSHTSADHHPSPAATATPHLIRGRWGCGRSAPAPLPHLIGRASMRTAPTTPPAPTTAKPTTCSPRAEYMYEITSVSTSESAVSFEGLCEHLDARAGNGPGEGGANRSPLQKTALGRLSRRPGGCGQIPSRRYGKGACRHRYMV